MGRYMDFDFFIVTFKKVLRDMNNMMGASVEMARMAKMDFCWWAQERERPRERKLRKREHSFRQLKFQIFATELHLHLYHLSTRVTQFVAIPDNCH